MNLPVRFCQHLRAVREKSGLTQRELARRAGLTETRVSDFERGIREPTSEQVESMAGALELSASDLTAATSWLSETERAALSSVSARQRRRLYRAFRWRPPRDREMHLHLRKAMAKWPNLVRGLIRWIEGRPDGSMLMRLLSEMPAGSAVEAVVHLTLLAHGADIVRVAPQPAGFRQHPVVDPSTRRAMGDCEFLAYAIDLYGMRCVLIPQVSMACRKSTWCVDFLAAVTDRRGVVHWLDLEVDGDGHDFSSDRQRSEDLDLPTARITQEEVLRGDTLELLADRMRKAVRGAALAA